MRDPCSSRTRAARGMLVAAAVLALLGCGGGRKKTAPAAGALLEQKPHALFVVGSASPLSSSDEALRARLVGLGFDVTIRTGPASTTGDAGGKDLVLVSESVASADVLAKFRDVPAPVVNLEPSILDDMKMTGPTWATDYGDADNQQNVVVLDAARGHPLAAGLSGSVQVASTASKFVWGAPSAEAVRVATISGQSGQTAIFAYEAGANMVGMKAPGRRVGWFAGSNTPAALTANGWKLFDAAIQWAVGRHALFVVGGWPLSAADAALRSRLAQQLGYQVETVLGPDTRTFQATGKDVIVISESTVSSTVGDRFQSVAVPIVCLEPALWDLELRMVGTSWGTDHGDIDNQTQLAIVSPGHPLAAGLPAGLVTTTTSPQKYLWGRPANAAVKVASLAGDASKYAIFGYEAGAQMVGLTAAARRVGWFAGDLAPAAFGEAAWALFEAAVRWAAQPQALLIVADLPPSPSDALLRNRLESPLGFRVEMVRAIDSQTAQASGKTVVVISESSWSEDILDKYRSVAVPVVSLEPAVWDDMGLTGTSWQTDFGDVLDQTSVKILDALHPLAAGLASGVHVVTTSPEKFVWGRPTTAAARVGALAGDASKYTIFGYEAGASGFGITFPARRGGSRAGTRPRS